MNKNIDNNNFICQAKGLLLELGGILGLQLDKIGVKSLSEEELSLINRRNDAKRACNFSEADKIRKELELKGIVLEDTKDGTTWRRKL
jgi:cysteinyl-tRNA synthetase